MPDEVPTRSVSSVAAAVTLPRRKVVLALLATTVLLTLASLAVQVVAHVFDHPSLLGLTDLLDMHEEANLPSWFSGVLLLACAVLLAAISAGERALGDPDARAWSGLALLFVAASVDEVTAIHEWMGVVIGGTQADIYWYLLPGSLLLLAVGIALRGFVSRLSGLDRRRLLLGIAIWALGAVALELLEAILAAAADEATLGIAALNSGQDFFELLGVVIVFDALARRFQEHRLQLVVDVADA